jgi:cation diffusion facilitator CzcD-associated flavoprotein CzcO
LTTLERASDTSTSPIADVAPLPQAKPGTAAASDAVRQVRVAVIGAGFSGLGLGMRMIQSGEEDFLIFERAEALGGTWRDNVYPGAECDIQTDLYSYSFAPNLNWSGTYAAHDEILAYLKTCSERFGVTPHIRFNHELKKATWDSDAQCWDLETAGGRYRASILVSGMGYLSEPKLPEIEGLESFAGTAMHTAKWDTGLDLKGKNVAVIGTGASAIQVIPEIQPVVGKLDVYQRTPPWIMGKHGKTLDGFEGWAMRNLPGYHRMKRDYHLWTAEMVVPQMARPSLSGMMRKIAQKHLDQGVTDPELKKKLQPDYMIGCRRILFSDTFYQSLHHENVELITDSIERIEPSGVVTADGKSRDADVLVLATGFQSSELPYGGGIVGTGGRPLAAAWREGQYAYLGATVEGFPNFFMLLGPNTTIAHTSITLMMEAQLNYVTDAISVMKKQGLASVDVKPEVVEAYNQKIQKSLSTTVWNAGGCQSYYLDSRGKNTTIWPHTTPYFHKLTRRFDVKNYHTTVEGAVGRDASGERDQAA